MRISFSREIIANTKKQKEPLVALCVDPGNWSEGMSLVREDYFSIVSVETAEEIKTFIYKLIKEGKLIRKQKS